MKKVPVQRVVECASRITRIPILTIYSKLRRTPIKNARFAVCMICREMGYSYNEIAKALEGRDHTTIMHSVQVGTELVQTDPQFAALLNNLRTMVTELTNVPMLKLVPLPDTIADMYMKKKKPDDRTDYEIGIDTKIIKGSSKLAKALLQAGGHR